MEAYFSNVNGSTYNIFIPKLKCIWSRKAFINNQK